MKSRILVLSSVGLFLFSGCRSQLLQHFASNDASNLPDPAKVMSGDNLGDRIPGRIPAAGNRNERPFGSELRASRGSIPATDVVEIMNRAMTAESDKQYETARMLYAEVLRIDRKNIDAHHRLAVIADLHRDFRTAEMHYRMALQNGASSADFLNDVGYSLLLQNRYQQSERALIAALEVKNNHEQAINHLGTVYAKLGDYEAAAAAFRRFLPAGVAESMLAQHFPSGRSPGSPSIANTDERLPHFGEIQAPRPTRNLVGMQQPQPGGTAGGRAPSAETQRLLNQMAMEKQRSIEQRQHRTRDSRLVRRDGNGASQRQPERPIVSGPIDDRDQRGDFNGYRREVASRPVVAPRNYVEQADGNRPQGLSEYDQFRLTGRTVPDHRLNAVMRDLDRRGSGHSSPRRAVSPRWPMANDGRRSPEVTDRGDRRDGWPDQDRTDRRGLYSESRTEPYARPRYETRQPLREIRSELRNEPGRQPAPRDGLWPINDRSSREPMKLGDDRRTNHRQHETRSFRSTRGEPDLRDTTYQRPGAMNSANRQALQLGRETGFGSNFFAASSREQQEKRSVNRRDEYSDRQPLGQSRPAAGRRFTTANLQRTFDSPERDARSPNFPMTGRDRLTGDQGTGAGGRPGNSRYAEPEPYRGGYPGRASSAARSNDSGRFRTER